MAAIAADLDPQCENKDLCVGFDTFGMRRDYKQDRILRVSLNRVVKELYREEGDGIREGSKPVRPDNPPTSGIKPKIKEASLSQR